MTTIYADQTYPPMMFAWPTLDASGNIILWDFTGWTLSVEVVDPLTNAVVMTKTSGVAGGPGTGVSNVAVTWTSAELATLAAAYPTKAPAVRVRAVNNADNTKVGVLEVDPQGNLPRLRVIARPT